MAKEDDGLYAGKNPDRSKWPVSAQICEKIVELGEILRPSKNWEVYQQVSQKMGTDCVLSIRLAKGMFEKDANRSEIKQKLKELGDLSRDLPIT